MRLLVRSIALAAALAACAAPDDRRKISSGGPGGGPGTGGTSADAGAGGDAFSVLDGKVCIATNLRTPDACVDLPGAGLPVSDLVSGLATTTADDSTFALAIGGAASALVDVETDGNAQLAPSVQSIASTGAPVVVPVVNATFLEDLESQLGTLVGDTQGILVLYVDDTGGQGIAGFSAVAPAGFTGGVFYDDSIAVGWADNGVTGAIGGVLMMGLEAGTYSIPLSNDTTGVQTSATARIVAGHVTFATITVGP